MAYVIGIDLGGTKIAAIVLDMATGKIIHDHVILTNDQDGADAVLLQIADLCRELCKRANLTLNDIDAIGVGVPAVVDYEEGRTLMLPNIPGDWTGKPIVRILQEHIGRPVWLINDARAFTLAEARLGAGRGVPVVACFTLGTGIGGGIAINGELHLGMGGNAAEFGHMSVDLNAPPDGSGTPGGMESFASGPAIAALGVKAVMQGATTSIGELVDYDLNLITPRTIMQAAESGDEVAIDILNRAAKYLGVGMANVIIVLSPHRIVLGGGVAQLGEWILRPLRETLKEYVHTTPLEKLSIVMAELGDDAGAIGAALWAFHQNQRQKA